MKALSKVLGMIREGVFTPDASRANYFVKGNPLCAGTPVHVVMQPFTPAPPGRAPETPKVACADTAQGRDPQEIEEVDKLDGWTDVKEELNGSQLPEARIDEVIEILSDTDSSASESDSDAGSTDEEELLDEGQTPARSEANSLSFCIQVKNKKSGVVHECSQRFLEDMRGYVNFASEVKGSSTACRLIDDRYSMLALEASWTDRCRVCYKGRRDVKIRGEFGPQWKNDQIARCCVEECHAGISRCIFTVNGLRNVCRGSRSCQAQCVHL